MEMVVVLSLSFSLHNASAMAFYTPPNPSECEHVRRRRWCRSVGSVVDMFVLAMISIVNVYL